jgi:hypothetical protein
MGADRRLNGRTQPPSPSQRQTPLQWRRDTENKNKNFTHKQVVKRWKSNTRIRLLYLPVADERDQRTESQRR